MKPTHDKRPAVLVSHPDAPSQHEAFAVSAGLITSPGRLEGKPAWAAALELLADDPSHGDLCAAHATTGESIFGVNWAPEDTRTERYILQSLGAANREDYARLTGGDLPERAAGRVLVLHIRESGARVAWVAEREGARRLRHVINTRSDWDWI